MIKTILKSGGGDNFEAIVTSRGQLVTAPLHFSDPYTATASVINTAYVISSAKVGERFVITDILLDADRNVSANTPATVVLYEGTSEDTTTASRTILSIEMLKNTNRVITGLNVILSENVWFLLKTDDATINATILGYYVSA